MPLPFKRTNPEALNALRVGAREKFLTFGSRIEYILSQNGGIYLVGKDLTYAEIMVAHVVTWFVEEVQYVAYNCNEILFILMRF